MPLKPLRRSYNCSDADLKQIADQISNCVTRDMTDFADYNISATDIAAFRAIIITFEDRINDDESLGEQQIETDTKNALRKQLEDLLRLIRMAAQLKYGNQGKYRKFGFDGFSTLTDNDFIRMVKRVGRVLAELETELTPSFPSIHAKLLALTTKGDAFDNAVNAIIDKKNARDIVTQDRILAGNAVYTELSRLSAIGKVLYQDINEAKYNDYVLGFQGGASRKPKATITTENTAV